MNNETRKETQVLPKDVRYVGADDLTLPLFENQYPVQPMGVSYNSYLILDEKIAVMDSVDARAADEWLAKLAHELDAPGRPLLFGTTEQFLRCFGVKSLEELPELNPVQVEEFKQQAEQEVQLTLNI